MHPVTLPDGWAYNIGIDDNLSTLAENVSFYLYETSNNRIIGRLKRSGSILEAYFEGVGVQLTQTPSTLGLKVFSDSFVVMGSLIQNSVSVEAPTVQFYHAIHTACGIDVIVNTLDIYQRLKAGSLHLKSSNMGTIHQDVLSDTTAIFDGNWTNHATVAACGDISFLNNFVHNTQAVQSQQELVGSQD